MQEAWTHIGVPGVTPTLLNYCLPVNPRRLCGVTLQDPLQAVYDYLQKPVTQEQATEFLREYSGSWVQT